MILDEFHKEIQEYVLSKCLQKDDQILVGKKAATFVSLPTIFYGKLGAPGVEPGIYIDRTKVLVSIDGNQETHDMSTVTLDPSIVEQRITNLEPGWHLISLAPDLLGELPETKFIEGDIVRLTDENHEHYDANLDLNQFAINRINYATNPEDTTYKLRAGKLFFNVSESQLFRCGDGPVRIFYGGESCKLRWRSVKDEAEFFLLLGRYLRIYNPLNKSYYWDLAQAQQMLSIGKGQAILQTAEGPALITFWDSDIGKQMTYYPELLLDI
jgi:hypothetical protein